MRKLILENPKLFPKLTKSVFGWHWNYLIKRKNAPISCSFYITNKCNFKCSFCNIWRATEFYEADLDSAKKLIEYLGKNSCFYFSVCGGEPLICKDLFAVLDEARKQGIPYRHLVTNGYLLTSEVAKRLDEVGLNEISISIDGEENIHDKLRNKTGAYQKALEAIENIKTETPKIRIVLNAILNPLDVDSAYNALKTAKDFKVDLKFQPINQHPVFDGENYTISDISTQDLNLPEIQNQVKEFIKVAKNEKRVVNSNKFLKNIFSFFYDKNHLIMKDEDCLLGHHHVEYFQNQLFPCLDGMDWKDGFQVNEDVEKVFNNPVYVEKLKNLKTCKKCEKNMYICYYEPRLTFPVWNFAKNIL